MFGFLKSLFGSKPVKTQKKPDSEMDRHRVKAKAARRVRYKGRIYHRFDGGFRTPDLPYEFLDIEEIAYLLMDALSGIRLYDSYADEVEVRSSAVESSIDSDQTIDEPVKSSDVSSPVNIPGAIHAVFESPVAESSHSDSSYSSGSSSHSDSGGGFSGGDCGGGCDF